MIVDAGGGTVDISAYGQTSDSKAGQFEEISVPECTGNLRTALCFDPNNFFPGHLQGSVFVTNRARAFLAGMIGSRAIFWCSQLVLPDYLRGSTFSEDIHAMTEVFDKSSKLTFDKISNPLFIRFGRPRDRDPKLNIRAGQLKLPGWVPTSPSPQF